MSPFRDPLPMTFHYAVLALVGLHGRSEFLLTRSLAFRHRLPEPTLAKVLRRLTQAGILESARGSRGGYRLARDPRDINLMDIFSAVQELDLPKGEERLPECCPTGQECPSLRLSAEISTYIKRLLGRKTLRTLIK